MKPFVEMAELGHEQVVLCRNDEVGLRAIIAIHNTTLGPALGGCRLYPYASEEEAMTDALRLSRGMTYKAAITGLDLGGGKSVIIGDPSVKSEGLFRAFGRQIASLNGRYITAEDMNTNVSDMNHIRRETKWVTGAGAHTGGSGDPSPVTAWGVFSGLRACLEVVYGSADVAGKSVAIQGVGNVGYNLARYLHERGATLVYSDVNKANIERAMAEFGGTVVEGDDLYSANVDVLAPCAIGGVINSRTIDRIRAPIIAGGANNVLLDERTDSERLMEKGITYAPDYVINAGGLLSVYAELRGWPTEKVMEDASDIFTTVKNVLLKAKAEGISTILASNRMAEERIETVGHIHRMHVG